MQSKLSPEPAATARITTKAASPRPKSVFERVADAFSGVVKLGQAATKPVPRSPDGLYPREVSAASDEPPPVGIAKVIYEQAKAGTLLQGIRTGLHAAEQLSGPIDDRKLLLEEVVTLLGSLPANSSIGTTISNTLIKQLWNDLPHPPVSFIGDGRFRSADGSGNNLSDPNLGKAGTHYARDVSPSHPMPHSLPDPGLVFDALLKRESFEPHPSGISSMLFSFATLVIHSAFQTAREDKTINETSSYLDLSPLYGNNQEEQNSVRTFQQGELWPDTFASDRLGLMPPHVAALLIVFCRNHNFIASKLFGINERGKFKPVSSLDAAGIKEQDETLFQTARLINAGFFVNVVFYDYIRVILNQNRTDSTWALFPNGVIKTLGQGTVPRGVGNACSIEFNILYRWHSAISAEDEAWTEAMFRKVLPDKPFDQITEAEFMAAMGQLKKTQGDDKRKWTFGNLKRQGADGTGHFKDSDISDLFTKATDAVAGSFRARGSPACMRIIDVLGIAMARNDWNACSLNEFRKFLSLKPFDSFAEWNTDPKIWKAAEKLYTHIDNLELFPGLSAEERKPSMPGSGLAPGYTISRAILSDAVALVRGDRYFTTDFTPASLTNWGFEDVSPDLAGGSFGGVMGKILMRALPASYTFNSIYALFPFSTPETTKVILQDLGIADKYDFSKPKSAAPWRPVFSYAGVLNILADHKSFGVMYGPGIKQIVGDYGFFIATDNETQHMRDRQVMDEALFPDGFEAPLKKFYADTTRSLLQSKSWSHNEGKTFRVDVVRDIASVMWAANQFGIPLKTDQHPHGLMTPQELYMVLSAFFIFVFMNFDPQPGFELRDGALSQAKLLLGIVSSRLSQVAGVPAVIDHFAREIQDKLVGINANALVLGVDAHQFYARLLKSERPREQLSASALSTMTASISNQAQVAALVVNFYLDPKHREHYTALVALSNNPSPESDDLIWAYILEVMRLDPQAPGIPRVANMDGSFLDGDRKVPFHKGDMIFASTWSAGRDPTVFINPDHVDVTRDRSLYRVFGSGMHTCLGAKLVNVSLVATVRELFKLKNVRRAADAPGLLNRFDVNLAGTPVPVYITAQSGLFPFPQSLTIVYDA